MTSVLIVAGESSGDLHAAGLVRAFKGLDPSVRFFGTGGPALEGEGVELLASIKDLALVGVFEIISSLPRVKRIFNHIVEECEARRPAAAVLVDSPDFNLRLAKALKKRGIPVLYYISPTVWAWRRDRLKTIKANVDKMLLIFPFETKIYREADIPAAYVGHPLIEKINVELGREAFARKFGLDPERRIITLLPGSRRSELSFHVPVLAEAAARIRDIFGAQLVLVLAEGLEEDFLRSLLPAGGLDGLTVIRTRGYEAMASSDLVLSSCGTATLEAALLGTPLVSFYRISPLTYFFGRPFVRAQHYCIVNILAGETVVSELIQGRFTADNLIAETRRLLDSGNERARMKTAFAQIRSKLGEKKASTNAARELAALLEKAR
jgi:lipid-A-disaccharide synthase